MSQIALKKCVKFDHPRFSRSREIPPESVGSGIFDSFFVTTSDRKYNDVISGVAVDNDSVDVPVKFGDSKSNGFWAIRGADFVSNEPTNWTKPMAYPNSAQRLKGVSPKI